MTPAPTKHYYGTADAVVTAYSWTLESADGSDQRTIVSLDEASAGEYVNQLLATGMRSRGFPQEWEALLNLLIEVHQELNAVGAVIFGANGLAKTSRFIDRWQ